MNWPGRPQTTRQPFMPDDHSEVVPLLPIPNRTVKRLSADDSAGSRVKVGHRQALTAQIAQPLIRLGALLCGTPIQRFNKWSPSMAARPPAINSSSNSAVRVAAG